MNIKTLVGSVVQRLFIIVWPPYYEENMSDIDISVGLVLANQPNRLIIISTNKESGWAFNICERPLPEYILSWNTFNQRMNYWMKSPNEDDIIDYEYYEATNAEMFNTIVQRKIMTIEFIKVQSIPEPFGVKIIFEDDYIISTSTSDGNTIETSKFNNNNNISHFEGIGIVEYINVLA